MDHVGRRRMVRSPEPNSCQQIRSPDRTTKRARMAARPLTITGPFKRSDGSSRYPDPVCLTHSQRAAKQGLTGNNGYPRTLARRCLPERPDSRARLGSGVGALPRRLEGPMRRARLLGLAVLLAPLAFFAGDTSAIQPGPVQLPAVQLIAEDACSG